jgi:hypothetical protein
LPCVASQEFQLYLVMPDPRAGEVGGSECRHRLCAPEQRSSSSPRELFPASTCSSIGALPSPCSASPSSCLAQRDGVLLGRHPVGPPPPLPASWRWCPRQHPWPSVAVASRRESFSARRSISSHQCACPSLSLRPVTTTGSTAHQSSPPAVAAAPLAIVPCRVDSNCHRHQHHHQVQEHLAIRVTW